MWIAGRLPSTVKAIPCVALCCATERDDPLFRAGLDPAERIHLVERHLPEPVTTRRRPQPRSRRIKWIAAHGLGRPRTKGIVRVTMRLWRALRACIRIIRQMKTVGDDGVGRIAEWRQIRNRVEAG